MIVAALIIGAGIMIIQLTSDGVPVQPLYLLLIVSYLCGGVLYLAVRGGLNPTVGLWGIMVADILLETAILHYSGGAVSQFSLIFYLTIVSGAIMLQVPGGVGTAIIASVCYATYGALEQAGWVHPPLNGLPHVASAPGLLQSYLHISIFLLVGSVGGHLADRMRHKAALLEEAESNLEQLRIDTDNILDHMSSGVLVTDSDGKILAINPAAEEILGFPKDAVISSMMKDVFADSMPEFVFELTYALNTDKNKFRHEITIVNAHQRKIPLGISISLLRDQHGVKRGVIAVFQDLTEVREMQERIRKADRLAAIGELSAGIAHEIRNPLASISGSIEMLYNELSLTGEYKRLMELVMKESDRLDRIISDFLEFARMRQPALREVPLERSIEDTLMLLNGNLVAKMGLRTEFDNACGPVSVRADEEQLKQVFFNLAINACEVMEPGKTLRITLEQENEQWIKVSFIDNGPGIGAEDMERLFEPFFTTKEGGTGLGLAITNKIVEAHGGRITFRNHEAGGAEFSVFLPTARKHAASSLNSIRHDEACPVTSNNGG
jgi:two-component system sensor histidine kinase PilS (NtrC family)